MLVDLDESQPLVGVAVQKGVDERRFAGTTRPPEQHVVGRKTAHELLRVCFDERLLPIDVQQVVEVDVVEIGMRA